MTGEARWHCEVLEPPSLSVLDRASESRLLQGFYLAGGTGLALRLGHRKSDDLDFFSSKPFSAQDLLDTLSRRFGGVELRAAQRQTLHVRVRNTEVSFLGYRYPLLFPVARFGAVAVADPRDIACMKLSAIASRGTRRDFLDLFAVARTHSLAALLEMFERKYRAVPHSRLHLLKSLVYFDDAEKDPVPQMLVSSDWDEVKRFFVMQVTRLA